MTDVAVQLFTAFIPLIVVVFGLRYLLQLLHRTGNS